MVPPRPPTCKPHKHLILIHHFLSITLLCVLSNTAVSNSLCPIDYSSPGFSAHGIFQAKIVEWGAISYSKGSSLTQRLNLCLLHLLHWQSDSSSLHHLGSSPITLPLTELFLCWDIKDYGTSVLQSRPRWHSRSFKCSEIYFPCSVLWCHP